mmetsp:Transcript_23343/g.53046  ORF Transcript_23343/g.53046 Transcript_23343/m.53046 type:complete len:87 (-) Transcript_23343:1623-1883(-)
MRRYLQQFSLSLNVTSGQQSWQLATIMRGEEDANMSRPPAHFAFRLLDALPLQAAELMTQSSSAHTTGHGCATCMMAYRHEWVVTR